MDPKIRRLTRITLLLVTIFFLWAAAGLIRQTFKIELLWGAGLGFLAIFALIAAFSMRRFGYWRGLCVMGISFAITYGALVLNSSRGWPFGFSAYHDILGWKALGVSWPLPILWSSIIGLNLILTQPKAQAYDPKKIFSWSFDVGILTMFAALIIEPLALGAGALSWSSAGAVLGVPGMDFIGWFLTGFVASFISILSVQIWKKVGRKAESDYLLFLSAFSALAFLFAWRLNLAFIEILTFVLSLSLLGFGIFRLLKSAPVKEADLQNISDKSTDSPLL